MKLRALENDSNITSNIPSNMLNSVRSKIKWYSVLVSCFRLTFNETSSYITILIYFEKEMTTIQQQPFIKFVSLYSSSCAKEDSINKRRRKIQWIERIENLGYYLYNTWGYRPIKAQTKFCVTQGHVFINKKIDFFPKGTKLLGNEIIFSCKSCAEGVPVQKQLKKSFPQSHVKRSKFFPRKLWNNKIKVSFVKILSCPSTVR